MFNKQNKQIKNKRGMIMKIDDKDKKNTRQNGENGFTKEKFKEFWQDKRTRWIGIAFVVMLALTIANFVVQGAIH